MRCRPLFGIVTALAATAAEPGFLSIVNGKAAMKIDSVAAAAVDCVVSRQPLLLAC